MPLSIDVCRAPIAVITEMTENTPMVMPTMVRPERSLFAPNDCRAMETISRKRMLRNDAVAAALCRRVRPGTDRARRLEESYSYLSAVTGSSLDADQAGANPDTSPVKTDTNIPIRTRPTEN